MTDFQMAMKIFAWMFALCIVGVVAVSALDSWHHITFAETLVRTLCEIMLMCVSGITGLFAGQHLERRKGKQ